MDHIIDTAHGEFSGRRALVVGVGGLGCPAAEALALAGVGTIGLVDPDVVDVSNLPRQLLYSDADVGRSKVEAAASALRYRAPAVTTPVIARALDAHDAALVAGYEVVIDGTDTVATKFVLNALAIATGTPLVHAGAIGWQAQLLTILPGTSTCYACIFEEPPPPDETPSCQDAGILGPAVALAGALQADEALRVLRGERPWFADRLMSIDLRTGTWRSVPVSRRPDCAVCGRRPS